MTHAVAIELSNWFAFKGDHRIELGPGVYAVVARREDDPDRSNWVGKSTFLASMPFALHGWHPARTEDGWITPGESQGAVTYYLSDGAVIRRTRKRGSATQLSYQHGTETQQGASAQQTIVTCYGMSETDLFMAAFFKQKEMARLLTMDPASRLGLVSDWLELGPLQKAEELAGQLARTSEASLAGVRARLVQAGTEVERLEQAGIEQAIEPAEHEWVQASAEVRKLQAEHAAAAGRYALERDAAEFERINQRGLQLKQQLEQLGEERTSEDRQQLRTAEQQALAAAAAKQQERDQVRTRGDFDGLCPVAGIQCPARAQINQSTAAARELREELDGELVELEERALVVQQTRAEYEQQVRTRELVVRELVQLRPRALALVDAKQQLAELGGAAKGDTGARLEAAQAQLREVTERLARLKQERDRLVQLRALQEREAGKVAAEEEATKLARTSALVYRAAQRVVAETTMSQIEQQANQVLDGSGIDLSVKVTWAREGNGPAKACDQCGAGFPTSAKVKVCGTCGATRGKHTVEKLEIGTSDISGAAEDLAGIAIRLAASTWLRDRRGAGWSMVAIDEPFGALDQANKRALGQHLVSMLTGPGGFEQALVVAHDRGIMDALPNRIELIGGREGTRFG